MASTAAAAAAAAATANANACATAFLEAAVTYALTCAGFSNNFSYDVPCGYHICDATTYQCIEFAAAPNTAEEFVQMWNEEAGKYSEVMVTIQGYTYDADGNAYVTMVNNTCADMYVFTSVSTSDTTFDYVYTCACEPYTSIAVPMVAVTTPQMPTEAQHGPIVILRADTPILHLCATLYRKGMAGYYHVEETLTAEAGFYPNLTALVAHLNSRIRMRGERNGFIYHLTVRKGHLRVAAAHKQPEPSIIHGTVLSGAIGMPPGEEFTLPLRTNSVYQMHGFVSPVIV